jgi:hypothetical protein
METIMASRRVKVGFGYHLAAFLAVNAVLIWINLDTSPDYFWAKWPLAGWGVALLFHGFSVFLSQVKSNKAFFYHLVSYIIINSFLIFINFNTYPEYLWFKFPLMAWTIILIFHGWKAFSNKQ